MKNKFINKCLIKNILILLSIIPFDLLRTAWLIKLILCGNKNYYFVSNENQIKNIDKYIYEHKKELIMVKGFKYIKSFPLSPFFFINLISIIKNMKTRPLSTDKGLDVFFNKSSEIYFFYLKLLKPKFCVLSREDIKPFTSIALVCQHLKIKLIVVEHGIFTREYSGFVATHTTVHIFSSEHTLNKRLIKPYRVFFVKDPLEKLKREYQKFERNPQYILLGDTHNIRNDIKNYAELIKKEYKVKIRLHPGQEHNVGNFLDKTDKLLSLSRSILIITGVSGFALECAVLSLPVILIKEKDKKYNSVLDVFEHFGNVMIVDDCHFKHNYKNLINNMILSFNCKNTYIHNLSDNEFYKLNELFE